MIPVPEKRIANFEKMGFGLFIHWGLYSQLGQGEWVQNLAPIDMKEYVKLMNTFTARDFDGREIAKTAKAAGMKYAILTTRHHDGFSLYDTCGLNEYDAPHSACGRDLVREFVDGCNSEGILPMFYHTTLDWHNSLFDSDFKEYQKYLRASVEILCKNYGPIGGLWFDGNWSKKDVDWEEDALYSMIRNLQPDAMIINNTGLDARGHIGNSYIDSVTFEQDKPALINRDGAEKYVAAEMCQTLNTHWGLGAMDFKYKSLPEVIETLCFCRKYGANYLLNVGPTAEGKILPIQKAMLEEVGRWIAMTAKGSLYEGKPSAIKSYGKDFILDAGNKSYLYVHDLGVEGHDNIVIGVEGLGPRSFKNAKRKVKNVKWTDSGDNLNFTQDTQTGLLCVHCTGYTYGQNLVVRVAEIEYAD